MERRLPAILAADMAGYSHLIEMDEGGVLSRQKTYRQEVIDPEITRHGGRIVKTTGDGVLVEFASAQEAVRCAIDFQTAMARCDWREKHADYLVQGHLGRALHYLARIIDAPPSLFDEIFAEERRMAWLLRINLLLQLVALYGGGAYSEAVARARHEDDAGGDPGHWLAVRREIARRVGKEIGLDTATRYLGG